MSFSVDANILLYATDETSAFHGRARHFLQEQSRGGDLLCLAWPTIIAYQRITTHPGIFHRPLSPADAWGNIRQLIAQPRVRVIGEQPGFLEDYETVTGSFSVRGNHVPDAHLATILRQNGVRRIYSADADFRKFAFLDVVNPFSS